MPTLEVDFWKLADFSEKQRQAYNATRDRRFILYGGAAGGGKSRWLRWALLFLLIRFYRKYKATNVTTALFCEDYPTLRDRQIVKMVREFPPYLGALKEYKDLGLAFKLRKEFGEGVILLRNLDDPSKYDSVEFAAVAVDELTRNVEETFDELRKRIRWPDLPEDAVLPFIAGTNPGGIGHGWVKRYWIDRDLPAWLKKYAADFAFIQAKAQDNPHNPPAYFEYLMSLPPAKRKQYAEGDWDLFSGQFFDEWRRELHVVKPYAIPRYWKRFVASDWGYAKPWCILWFAVSPEGRVVIYRELYLTQQTPAAMMKQAIALSSGEEYKYKLLDPACWDSSRGVSIADQCAAAGWTWEKADHDRESGWSRVREHLHWEKDESERVTKLPTLEVFETCANVIRTLPAQVYDKTKPEDLDTDGEDHAADTVRYGLMSLPGVSIVPLEALPDEYAEAAMRAAHSEKQPAPEVPDME